MESGGRKTEDWRLLNDSVCLRILNYIIANSEQWCDVMPLKGIIN